MDIVFAKIVVCGENEVINQSYLAKIRPKLSISV